MTQNLHVCTICFRPEVVYDVISGINVKTIEGKLAANLEVASSNNFRDIQKNHFVTAEAEAEAAADLDDSIKRKRIRVSLNKQKSPRIVGLRPPMCSQIFWPVNFDANQLNILVYLLLL